MGHPLADALQWHIDNGVDVVVGDAPVNRLKKAEMPPMPVSAPAANDAPQAALVMDTPRSVPAPAITGSHSAWYQKAVDAAKACNSLEDLQAAIRAFDGLEVKRTATNMVFADGNPKARVMVIGEAPGADEDRQGLPFVGVSGQLLDRMFACINLSRKAEEGKDAVYISNILNWRPPGNRTPNEGEIALALPFIERHIALVRPEFLMLMGAVASKPLLDTDQSISKLRGRFYPYKPVTPDIGAGLEPFAAAPRVLPSYHPSFLLRTPVQKRKAWQDLLMLSQALHSQTQ